MEGLWSDTVKKNLNDVKDSLGVAGVSGKGKGKETDEGARKGKFRWLWKGN